MSDQSTEPTEYRLVPGFPHYRVGNDGSFWTKKPKGWNGGELGEWRQLPLSKNRFGYIQVHLRHNGKQYLRRVQHLVLIAFGFARPSEKHLVRHINGIRDDNRLCNIAWGTHKENSDDMIRHGTRKTGEDHQNAKFTNEDIHRIRNDYSELTNAEVAEIFHVNINTICAIRSRRRWKHLP